MTHSVYCCIFFQIVCILQLLEANPKAQQTHISSALMMNLFMKSEFLKVLAHLTVQFWIVIYHFIVVLHDKW